MKSRDFLFHEFRSESLEKASSHFVGELDLRRVQGVLSTSPGDRQARTSFTNKLIYRCRWQLVNSIITPYPRVTRLRPRSVGSEVTTNVIQSDQIRPQRIHGVVRSFLDLNDEHVAGDIRSVRFGAGCLSATSDGSLRYASVCVSRKLDACRIYRNIGTGNRIGCPWVRATAGGFRKRSGRIPALDGRATRPPHFLQSCL